MRAPTFTDRRDAGRRLSQRLKSLAGHSGVVVLALPRGGIPVGLEVARALRVPLDVFTPTPAAAPRSVRGATVVLVDDGVATGSTMLAAVRAMRELGAGRVVVAAPIVASGVRELLEAEADLVEFVSAPEDFKSVAGWYRDYHDMSDAEVRALLKEQSNGGARDPEVRLVRVNVGDAQVTGDLSVPGDAAGLVLFAHCSGSGRMNPRNRDLAAILQREGFATLLFDLLTPREEATDRLTDAFHGDIALLAARLVAVSDWAASQHEIADLPLGYFGAGTGTAAALVAAARRDHVQCIVSRGGQPDLAGDALGSVGAATLFIVGGMDRQLLVANRAARERMRHAKSELAIIPGAGHLCEERGILEEAARLASEWFKTYLVAPWAATR